MIKLVFGSKNKIIKLQKPTFQSLTLLIKQSFADLPIDYSLSYLDTDKDEICLNSDQDLFIMLNSGIKINKIYVKQSLSQVIQITDRIQPSFQIYQHRPEQKQVSENKILPLIEEKIIQQVVVQPDNDRVDEEKKEEKQVIKEQPKKQQVKQQISESKEIVLEVIVAKEQVEEEERPVNKSIILNVSQNNQIQITEDVLIEAVKKIMINQQQERKKQLKEQKKEVIEQKKEVIEKKEAVQVKKEVVVEEKKILKQEKIEVKQQKKEVKVEKEQVKPQKKQKQQVKPQVKDQKRWHKKQYSPMKKDNVQLAYHNVICSYCNDEYGIIGVRYQCIFCEHFNLCSVCQQVVAHEHSLLKVKVPKQAIHKDQIISKYKKQIFANSESLPNSHYVPSISKDEAHVFIQAGKKTMAQSFERTQKLMTEFFLKMQMSHKNPYEVNKPIPAKKESPRQKVEYLIDFLGISQKDAYTFCNKYHGFTKEQLLNIYVQKRASNAL